MEGLLRSHQADTTARRLQLERALAQRQGELRSRTQGLEELTVKHSEARKVHVGVCVCVWMALNSYVYHIHVPSPGHWPTNHKPMPRHSNSLKSTPS